MPDDAAPHFVLTAEQRSTLIPNINVAHSDSKLPGREIARAALAAKKLPPSKE